MPNDLVERVYGTQSSGTEQFRSCRFGAWISPSGLAYVGRQPPHRVVVFLAAPAQSPTDSESGRRIQRYVQDYLSGNLELASPPTSPAGVSSSPLARAATMTPWDAINRRRIRLIDKKYKEGLNAREAEELGRLKRQIGARMQVVAPRTGDVLDEQAARLERLKRKKAQAKKGKIS